MSNPYLPVPYTGGLPGSLIPQTPYGMLQFNPYSMGGTAGPGIPMGPTMFGQQALGSGAGAGVPAIRSALPGGYGTPTFSGPGSIPYGAGAGDVSGLYTAEELAASGGGASQLAAQLGRTGVGGALRNIYGATAGGEGIGSLGFYGVRAGAARALPGLALAELGPKAINALPGNQNAKDVLGNVVAGAGIGAAAGAPFELVGAIPGAAIGGTIGLAKGLTELFSGDDTPSTGDYKSTLSSAATQFGLNPNNYTAAFDLLTKAGADPKTLTTQLAQQLIQDGQAKQQQDQAVAIQQQQHASDQQFALAIQTQAAKFFTPYVNNIISAGQAQSELLKGQAQNLPAPYRDVFLNQAQQALSESQRLAGAYAAQAAGLPGQYMYSADLKRQQQLAQLQYQQSVVNAQQGGGGADFQQLLAQQTGG